MSRPETEGSEAVPMSGELGMVRTEVLRVGKELREGMAEIRLDLKEGLAELRKAHDDRRDEITDVRLTVAALPTAARVAALEEKVEKHGQKLEGLAVKVMVAGTLFIAGIEAVVHIFVH